MRGLDFVKVNNNVVHVNTIRCIDISPTITETVVVGMMDGTIHYVSGPDAVLLVWQIKPSALEGRRDIQWKKHMWAIHNLIAHPLMQILAWFRLYPLAIWVHDITVPKPISFKRSRG